MTREEVLAFLKAKRSGSGWSAKCPVHDDKQASLGIYEREGRLWFQCFAGCAHGEIAKAIGYQGGERMQEFKPKKLTIPSPNPAKIQWWWENGREYEDEWCTYRGIRREVAEAYGCGFKRGAHPAWLFFVSHQGQRVAVKAHLEGEKRPRKAQWLDVGSGDHHGFPWLYPEPDGSGVVFLCPGELKALGLISVIEECEIMGATATSITCGESSGLGFASKLLAGRDVIVVQDQDKVGREWGDQVEADLSFLARSVIRKEFPGEGKVDANDYIRTFGVGPTGAMLREWMTAVPKKRSVVDILTERQKLLSQRATIEFPWPSVNSTHALLPATTTVICGAQSAAKSFAMLQMLTAFFVQGHKPALLMLEDDLAYHLRRLLAQHAGESRLTDHKYCQEHENDWGFLLDRFSREMDGIQEALQCLPPDVEPTCDRLQEWAEAQLARGANILMVDPVTKMATGKDGYVDDAKFMRWAVRLGIEKSFPIVVSTHPKKGCNISKLRQSISDEKLDAIAGGACYSRFSQTVFWLWRHEDEESYIELGGGVGEVRKHNRTLECLKSRNARMTGHAFALDFDWRTCRLNDVGQIKKGGG